MNQTAGRVIRHKNDFGCILFIDERFMEHRCRSNMSEWIVTGLECFESYGHFHSKLCNFFRTKMEELRKIREANPETFKEETKEDESAEETTEEMQAKLMGNQFQSTQVICDDLNSIFGSRKTKNKPKAKMASERGDSETLDFSKKLDLKLATKNMPKGSKLLRPYQAPAVAERTEKKKIQRNSIDQYCQPIQIHEEEKFTSANGDSFGKSKEILNEVQWDKRNTSQYQTEKQLSFRENQNKRMNCQKRDEVLEEEPVESVYMEAEEASLSKENNIPGECAYCLGEIFTSKSLKALCGHLICFPCSKTSQQLNKGFPCHFCET